MVRQIGARYQAPSVTALEERLHHLEMTVATVRDAVRLLARALEDGPMAEPGDRAVVEAARQAYDLLLAISVPASAGGGKGGDGERG